MKKLFALLILVVFAGESFSQQLDLPVVSSSTGIYTTDQTVTITHSEPGVTLFYTLNGSEPGPGNSVYSGSFTLSSRNGEPNSYSEVPTNPSFTYPVGDYSASRANNRGWLAPYSEVFKINILRVKAYKAGFVPSETVTRTIMVDPSGASIYAYPIVSIVLDSLDLFSNVSGIYHYGDHPEGNYTQKGSAWERIGHFDYFDAAGNHVLDQDVRLRIHGGGSRHSTQKTFRIYAEYDSVKNFKYQFFDDIEVDKFKRILLRTGGHRPDCFPRDNLGNMITANINTDQQHFKHVIVFINGEYWGIQSIKERVDKYFIQNQYGIDDNQVTILDQEYDIQDGHSADSLQMSMIETLADTGDMTLAANYQWIADRVDIENYIDYMGSEIFLSNEDWVYSNVVIWRKTGPYDPSLGPGQDGKFRWIMYDLDGAFGGSCDNAYYTVNTLESATVETGIFSTYSRLFRGMLENEGFKQQFINRLCDLMNSHFKSSVLHEKMDQIYAELTVEMPEHVNRWRYPSEATTLGDRQLETPTLVQWDTTFYYLHRFADRRQRKIREHILDKWGYPDTSDITLDVNDINMGRVQINTILINEQLPGTDLAIYPWTGQYIDSLSCQLIAVPLPGYEFVEWLESGNTNDTVNWIPNGDTTITAVFQLSTDFEPVVINELMPSNGSYLADNFNEYDDWLELYNPNPYSVNLSNCRISRDAELWVIPNGTIIQPNDYLLFWMDADLYQGVNHANFKLTNGSHTVSLSDPNGSLIDFISYPQTITDNSYGRYPNGSSSFSNFTYPTPLQNNDISSVNESLKIENTLVGYPNPAQNEMYFNKSIDFKLFSLDGKLVFQKQNSNQLDLSQLQNGTYILLSSEGENIKVMVQH